MSEGLWPAEGAIGSIKRAGTVLVMKHTTEKAGCWLLKIIKCYETACTLTQLEFWWWRKSPVMLLNPNISVWLQNRRRSVTWSAACHLCQWVFTCACMTVPCSLSVWACSFHSAAWTSNWLEESRQRRVTDGLYLLLHVQLLLLHSEAFLCFVNSLPKQLQRQHTVNLRGL